MAQYAHVGDGPNLSENDAMYAFSQAKLDGVKIMDLPDAPKALTPVDDAQAALIYQANEQEKQ